MKYTSGAYRSGYLLQNIREIEDALTAEWKSSGMTGITNLQFQKDITARIEDASKGRNTVRFDDNKQPSVMVRFNPDREGSLAYLYGDSTGGLHPAFIIDGLVKPFEVGKYPFGRVGSTNYPVCLRGLTPAHSQTFDQFQPLAVNKGAGFHLMTNAEWAYITLLSMRKGFQCRGNTYYGKHHVRTDEFGIMSSETESIGTRHTLCGTGPVSWSHDGTPFGVYEMVGNVWLWVGGFRILNGEIQVLPNNNAAGTLRTVAAHAVASTDWKAFLVDGTLVSPEATLSAWATATAYVTGNVIMHNGVRYKAISDHTSDSTNEPGVGASWETAWIREGTLHYIYDGAVRISDYALGLDDTSRSIAFSSLAPLAPVTVPDLVKQLLLAPRSLGPLGQLYVRNAERFPRRGASRNNASSSGLGALSLYLTRGVAYSDVGGGLGYTPS